MKLQSIRLARRIVFSCAAIGFSLLGTAGLATADELKLTSQAEVYRTPEGYDISALSVRAVPGQLPAREIEQVLILIDTSASQVGQFRQQAIEVCAATLQQIPASTKVAVWAVDVQQTPLTDGFVSVDNNTIEQVINQLKRRIPAGSTQLAAAFSAGLDVLAPTATSAMIYIGDGYSAAELINRDQLSSLTTKLNQRQIPVISYAIGSQTDLQLLGILALRSGGIVLGDEQNAAGSETAAQLLKALRSGVWYPTSLNVSENVTILPAVALPIREDRETTYLSQQSSALGNVEISLADQTATGSTKFAIQTAENGHTALRALWMRGQEDNGLSIPTAGQLVRRAAEQTLEQHVGLLLDAASEAADKGQVQQSLEITKTVLQLDPRNTAAAKMVQIQQVALLQADGDIPPIVSQLDELEQNRTDAPTDTENDLIQQFKNRSKVAGERLSLQVSRAVDEARAITQDDPNAAISVLKGVLGAVRSAADIDPEIRAELERKVGNVILEVRSRREQIQNQKVRFAQELAEREARQRVIEDMLLEEERLEQLIDQVRALLDDGFHGDVAAYAEAEAVAEAAVELSPFSGVSNSARFTAEAAGQLEDARYLRALRADRFLETLTQVEFSHVPFPDEPPVRWPSAPVWKALTERRKVWASVDLKDDSPAERRIRSALDEETELQFVDTPLRDALDIIGELHNITIFPDEIALEDAGISTDEPVTLFISGVRLRSALKIMLEKMPEPLTWVIEDEVMKITTVLVAEEILETRVYPVADLVIPIQTLGGGGLGGGGGLLGGQQGGGQQGGGQFGGGGGGGQFGGGGFFSIPAPQLPATAKKNLN